jgi:hypothetical protein
VLLTVFTTYCTDKSKEKFVHRGYLGWLTDLSRTDRPEVPWPSIVIDSSLIEDYKETLDFLHRSGMNEITVWGLFTNTSWEPEIKNTISAEREAVVKDIIFKAHLKGIKIICGVGVYSWGFSKIIKQNPEVKCPCNDEVMDISKPQAWEWQRKVLDYLMDNYQFDGVSLQSSDRGRCTCGEFGTLSNLEYHARLNQMVINYIRTKKKNYIIGISGWGMNFGNPPDLTSIVQMTKNVDYLIDVEESALKAGKTYRQKLIQAIAPCKYGNTGTPNIEPIQALPRNRYFVPTAKRSCQRLKELYNDGGRACETYYRTRGNPGDEFTIEVMAHLLNDPGKDITAAFKETIIDIYHPINDSVLNDLTSIFYEAEDAYFKYAEGEQEIILLMNRNSSVSSSQYLKKMSPSSLLNYKTIIQDLYNKASMLAEKVDSKNRFQLLLQCFENVLNEIENI